MTIESRELFELCKEVYERFPEWETSDWYDLDPDGIPEEYLCTTEDKIDENDYIPNYTSDYLLEKLPRQIEGIPICLWAAGRSDWMAEYDGTGQFEGANERISMLSDTPLKALLLLTLKLHEEGLL